MSAVALVTPTRENVWQRTFAANVFAPDGELLFVKGWRLDREAELEVLRMAGPDQVLIYLEN